MMLVVTNLHTLMLVTAIFKEPSCTYVAELTAEFCARPMDNSTTFGILELWPIHGNHHFSPVPGQKQNLDLGLSLVPGNLQIPGWFVYLLEQVAYCQPAQSRSQWNELVEKYCHEYKTTTKSVFYVAFFNMMLSCEIWSVPHANELPDTSNAARNRLIVT